MCRCPCLHYISRMSNRRRVLPLLTPVDRRDFLTGGAVLVALPFLGACASDDATSPAQLPAEAFVIDGNDVVIVVSRVPALAVVDRAAILLEARVIVVRTDAAGFRALSVECPHAGCGVSIVDGARLICPCHASVFDLSGRRLDGPAPRGLTQLVSVFDASTGLLRVRRA